MSRLVDHAKKELEILGNGPDFDEHILEMVGTFAGAGHSGFSAAYAIEVITKLLKFEPLSPLTGEEGEWESMVDGISLNKRCSRVFKKVNANYMPTEVYDSQGKVFLDKDGLAYTSNESLTSITFPYTPHTEIVEFSAEDLNDD